MPTHDEIMLDAATSAVKFAEEDFVRQHETAEIVFTPEQMRALSGLINSTISLRQANEKRMDMLVKANETATKKPFWNRIFKD